MPGDYKPETGVPIQGPLTAEQQRLKDEAEEREERRQERAEDRSFRAHQRATNRAMVWVTMVGVAVALIGSALSAALGLIQAHMTQQAIETANRQAKASEDANRLARQLGQQNMADSAEASIRNKKALDETVRQNELAAQAMNLGNRPWISMIGVKPSSQLDFSVGTPYMNVLYTVKNEGRSPATNLAVFGTLIPMLPYPVQGYRGAYGERNKLCRDAKKQWHSGVDVGPGEGWSEEDDLLATSKDESLLATIRAVKKISLTLVGCVVYESVFSKEKYEVSFTYTLHFLDPSHNAAIWMPTDEGNIEPSKLEFWPLIRDRQINQ